MRSTARARARISTLGTKTISSASENLVWAWRRSYNDRTNIDFPPPSEWLQNVKLSSKSTPRPPPSLLRAGPPCLLRCCPLRLLRTCPSDKTKRVGAWAKPLRYTSSPACPRSPLERATQTFPDLGTVATPGTRQGTVSVSK